MSTSIDIGIAPEQRQQIADGLGHLLADTWVLYGKTHGFHWNVTGPMFNSLHTMFETQYNELALAVDEIAEQPAVSLDSGYPAADSATVTQVTLACR